MKVGVKKGRGAKHIECSKEHTLSEPTLVQSDPLILPLRKMEAWGAVVTCPRAPSWCLQELGLRQSLQ